MGKKTESAAEAATEETLSQPTADSSWRSDQGIAPYGMGAAGGASISPTENGERAALAPSGPRCDSFVYCGPSVRGVAKRYKVYSGGLPTELVAFSERHPAARGLIVPLEQFAETRAKLETPGTAEAVLYHVLEREIASGV